MLILHGSYITMVDWIIITCDNYAVSIWMVRDNHLFHIANHISLMTYEYLSNSNSSLHSYIQCL